MSNNRSFIDKLDIYQNKLLQLNKSNRCICLGRIYNKHSFDLSRLLDSHPEKIDALVQQSFKHKKSVCILPDSDLSDEAMVMRRHLKALSRNIKQQEDETGSQYCYFGFPFLEGHIDKEHYTRGPLALFPVSVNYERKMQEAGWHVTFFDSSPIFNHTLFAALEKIGGFKMSDTFESDFEDLVLSSDLVSSDTIKTEFAKKLFDLLKDNGLPLDDSNPDEITASDPTPQLQNITKTEIDSFEIRPLRINNYKIIGNFAQGESAIYQDYDNLISAIGDGDSSDFVAAILDAAEDADDSAEDADDSTESADETKITDLDKVSDENLNLIVPSDSSQDRVVLASQNNPITVVRGPPGTGKSQVIVNVISNALAKGQTILVVCQKRAALDVVHQRLADKNLDRYAVLLNKEKEDRAKMYHQLKQILEHPYTKSDVDKKMSTTSKELDELIVRHSQISYALSKQYFDGITVRDLYTKSTADYSKRLDLAGIANNITHLDLDGLFRIFDKIQGDYKKFEDENYSWKNRKDFPKKHSSDKNKIKNILSAILSRSADFIILSDKSSQDSSIELSSKHSSLNSKIRPLELKIIHNTEIIKTILGTHDASISLAPPYDDLIKRVQAGLVLWRKFPHYDQILNVLKDSITEQTLQRQTELIDSLSESDDTSFFKKTFDSEIRRKAKNKKNFLKRTENQGKSQSDLIHKLQNGLGLWNLVEDASLCDYLFSKSLVISDKPVQKLLLDNLIELDNATRESLEHTDELQTTAESMRKIFEENKMPFDSNTKALTQRLTDGQEISADIEAFSEFVNDQEMEIIYNKISKPAELRSHIQNLDDNIDDFDDLQSYDIQKSQLNAISKAILDQCVLKMKPDENWAENIRQEIYHHWIEFIEQDQPILKSGCFDDYKDNQATISSLMEQKSDLLVKSIIDKIESNANFRPGSGNKSTRREADYNKLNYELGKKRRVKPVRKLLQEYGHILFDLAPCWLASPEMISNIFPLEKEMFDLIIVDEASQLAAERALPFLHRGERIIIAGDEKQLKPHDLFQVKEDDEDGDDDTVNIESLLLLANRRYASTTLRWHYRSQWQELIDFSNHAFYAGMLQVSPNVHADAPEPPIQWVECAEGMWENRSNAAEAAKVVDVLYDILQDNQGKELDTIGIITFNDEQRHVIMDAIEIRQKKDPAFDELYKKIETPASGKKDDEIFVRNIENVQGDERDIIIFSVGYAKDSEGKFRLQFGTLNQDGGENRLNVAVTRASQKIVVVCSIDPRDMKTENTKNPGPKRLRDFLLYAKAVSNKDKEKTNQILASLSSGMNITRQQTKQFDSPFEEQVHDKLEALGYSVETQVGQSSYRIDLAVVHPYDPHRYILGIECDGAMYHSAKSVRERDVTRQQFLERRGWTIDRIWSRNWWRNSDKEVQRIKERIESLVKN